MKVIELRKLDIEQQETEHLLINGIIKTDTLSHLLGKGKNNWYEKISKGVFKRAIESVFNEGKAIDLLLNHSKDKLLASTINQSLRLIEESDGLHFEASLSNTTYARDLHTLIKDGLIGNLSFGMIVKKDDWSYLNGIPLRTIKEIELLEISVIKTGAYPETAIEARDIEIQSEPSGLDLVQVKKYRNLIKDLRKGEPSIE